MSTCANKNAPEYKALAAIHGEGVTNLLFQINGNELPSIEKAAELLSKSKGTKYSDIQEIPWKTYDVRSDIKDTSDFGAVVGKILEKKNELKAQGAQIKDVGEHGFQYRLPVNEHVIPSSLDNLNKITNVKYPISDTDRALYRINLRSALRNIFGSGEVLFMQGNKVSNAGRIFLQPGKESYERLLQAYEQQLSLPQSTPGEGGGDQGFEELFRGTNDQPYSVSGLAAFIASRLLQSSDSFSGRILHSLAKEGLAHSSYIRIENDPEQSLYYFDGKGIYINIDKLPTELRKFSNVEDFIKATELIITEEVIHGVAFLKASDKQLIDIYNELQPKEVEELKKTYRSNDPIVLAHEYLRTLIQEDIFGTSTYRELNPKEKEVINQAISYISEVFKDNPTRVSQEVIKEMKDYIKGVTGRDKFFQLTTDKNMSNRPVDQQLNNKIRAFLTKLGVSVEKVNKILTANGQSANAMVDSINKVIRVVEGKEQLDTLGHEAAHLFLDLLPGNSTLLRDLLRDVRNRDEYTQVLEQYRSLPEYQDAEGNIDEEKIAKEAAVDIIGKMIAGRATDKKAKNLWQRIWDFIRKLFKDAQELSPYEQVASDILAADTSKLNNIKSVKNELQGIIAGKQQQEEGDTIQTALSYFRTVKETGQGEDEEGGFKQFAQQNLSITPDLKEMEQIAQGQESLVYHKDNSPVVLKLNDGALFKGDWEAYLNNLLIHNYFFPDVAYTLQGFTTDKAGNLLAVVQQPYVRETAPVDMGEVKDYLGKMGFKVMPNSITGHNFINKELGIELLDVQDRNVINNSGEPFFIDTVFKLTPAFYEATGTGTQGIHYQLSKEEEQIAREAFKKATPMQKKIIEEVYFEPHTRLMLDPDTHTYIDTDGVVYESVTTAIGQDFPEELKEDFNDNRDWGNDADAIMQGIILRKPLREIETKVLPDNVKQDVHDILREYYGTLVADGSVVLPQVIVADKESGIAGSIDILRIDPYGNMKVIDLKTSWSHRGSSSFTNQYPLKADSRIVKATAANERPVKSLNKVQVHGTQIGVYGKLLQLAGWSILDDGLITKHLYFDTIKQFDAAGEFIGKKVVGVRDEGVHLRNPGDNVTTVSAIVPTALTAKDRLQEINDEFHTGNPIRTKAFQETFKVADNIDELLHEKVLDAAGALKVFSQHLESLKHLSGKRLVRDETGKVIHTIARFEARDRFVDRMNELYSLLSKSITHENQVAAYNEFLNFTQQELAKISEYLTTTKEVEPGVLIPANVDKPNYIDTALLARKYIETFEGITDLKVFGNAAQASLLANVVQDLNNTKADIDYAVLHYIASIGQGYTSRKNLTYEDILKLLKRDKDITNSETSFGTIGNSGVFIIENAAKMIKDRMLAAEELAKERIEHFIPIAEKLRNILGKIDKHSYDFMTRIDREGKRMGQIVSQIGRAYRELQEKVYNDLVDVDGKPIEYREVKDITTASPEDIQHNIDLWYKKQKVTKFEEAEVIDSKGNISSGEYHQYRQEFLDEREKYMELQEFHKKKGEPYYLWMFKTGETEVEEKAIVDFKRKYFTDIEEYMKMELEDGAPTGVVTKDYDKWVVKRDYIKVRDTEKSTGKPIADPEYLKLMNPTTELGRVQKEYYEAYTDMMGEIIDMLPANAAEIFKKGNIPTIGTTWVQQLANGNINMGVLIANAIKAQVSSPVEMGKDTAAYSGSSRQSIPLLYVAPIQSQLQLDKIAAERAELLSKQKEMPADKFSERMKELNNLEKKERLKMKASDLHPDLTLGLTEMIKAATQFQAKSDLESTMIALRSHLNNMEFEQTASKFGKTVGMNLVKGENSNALKRWAGYLDMCFYHDPLMNRNTADALVRKLMGITSVLGVSFNLFGWVNNVVTGTVNNWLDGIGGDFWNPKAMKRMTLEFQAAALGYAKNALAHKNQQLFGKGTYEERKAGSKYEAICDHFHAIEHYQAELRGQFSLISSLGGYAGMEAGEYMMQSKVATAILASIPIKNNITGEETTVYDAYKWNEKEGKVELKDGYTLTDKERHLITNRIRETIDRIHGNYSPENKTMFEKEWWGTLIMQFHKWFWPNFKQRFQRGKYDENLGGGMEIEGRYRTLWNFVKGLNNLADLTKPETWNKLTDHQKHNLQKDMADIGIIAVLFAIGHVLKSLADGIPDNDPQLKRWVHYLQYQSDRSIQEVSIFVPGLGLVESYQLLKNPIAGAGSIRQFGELLQATYHYPFIDDEHRYYQRGAYAGQSHIAKELRDVFPILYEYNRLQSLITTNTFYVK